jgi:hypothetical protein
MTISVQVGGAWKEGTPDKVNVGGVWKTVSAAKVNVGGVWKDVFPSYPPGSQPLTNVAWRNTGNPYEVEFTVVGGSGTYIWDWDGPSSSTEGGGYGTNVTLHTYKSSSVKTVTCQDMGNAEHPEWAGNIITITGVRPTA